MNATVKHLLLPSLLALLMAGCQSAGNKKLTPKEQAEKKWNAARAGVQSSLAREQYKSGNFDECRQTVNSALEMDPENAGLHVLSAKLAI